LINEKKNFKYPGVCYIYPKFINAVKKAVILSVIVFLAVQANGQSYTLQSAFEFYQVQKLNEKAMSPVLNERDISGSPYENSDFKEGFLVTSTNQKFVGLSLRYNIYNDRIEYRDNSGASLMISYPEAVDHIVIGDSKYIYSPFSIIKRIEKGYFKVIEEGKAALYAKQRVFFQEAQPPGAYKDPEPPKFLKKPDEYYVRIVPAEARKVGNKNELLLLFPDKQKEIEDFIKKNKTKTNSSEDLAQLVKYYNSLQ